MAEATDHVKKRGGAALGARLRRLSEAIDRDASRVYATIGVRFEQRWFGVLDQLARNGPMTVSELAAALRIARASVSQTRQSLEDAGVVAAEGNPLDARQRHLALTPAGAKLVRKLGSLWQAMEHAALELDAEAGNVVAALDRLDEALARQPMFDRIVGKMAQVAAPARPRARAAPRRANGRSNAASDRHASRRCRPRS